MLWTAGQVSRKTQRGVALGALSLSSSLVEGTGNSSVGQDTGSYGYCVLLKFIR